MAVLRKSPSSILYKVVAETNLYFVASLRVVAENVVTDREKDTQTYKPSTVTFAVHACILRVNYFYGVRALSSDAI